MEFPQFDDGKRKGPGFARLPEAVIFDLDGLILDSERCYCIAWQRAAEELGVVLQEELYARFVGLPNSEAEVRLAEHLGENFPLPAFQEGWRRHWNERVSQEEIPSKPGFQELIDYLAIKTIPRAVATSSDHRDALLNLGKRAGWFQAIVTRDDVLQGKPAPDLFLEAASRLRVPPSCCLALEDSETGFFSARAAGMQVIIVPDMKSPGDAVRSAALEVLPSLREVRVYLESL